MGVRVNRHACGFRITIVTGALSLGACLVAAAQPSPGPPQCQPSGELVRVPELREGSGGASSRKTPGHLWAHNDSGEPVLFALDQKGAVIGRLQLSGARVEDWEAVSVGPCPAGSCIYVADIGDNDAKRAGITVYRVQEPASTTGAARVDDVFHATYPDGPHDAESLFVTADGRIHIVTKGDTGPVAVYRFPVDSKPSASAQLERVGPPRGRGKPGENDRITDSAVSPDGEWVVLRSNHALTFYRSQELLGGNWRESARLDLKRFAEPQGEGVAFGSDNSLYLVGEGGGKSQPGTFAHLRCASTP